MAITFKTDLSKDYFICQYEGRITDAEALDAWKNYLEGNTWKPEQNEFADLSKAQFDEITVEGLMRLARYIERIYKENNIEQKKVAVYSPNDLPFGIARMYAA